MNSTLILQANQSKNQQFYSGMNRTKPYLNKFTLKKQLDITDTYHEHNMKEMKPITSKLMEHSESIVINHSKRQKMKEAREMEIERENQALLQRMSSVLNKQGTYSPHNIKFRTKVNRSLNHIFRKKQEQQIALQNQRQFFRIFHKKPTLNLEQMDRDWKHNRRVIKKMSNCQFYLTTFRQKEQHNRQGASSSIQLKDKMEAARLSKTMILDGHRMLVKIEWVNGCLKIRGDLIGQKKYQLIQIQREQALKFVQEDCQGRIENIFEKLRYESKDQILYVIGNYEENTPENYGINPEVQQNEKEDKTIPATIQQEDKTQVQSAEPTHQRTSKEISNARNEMISQQNNEQETQLYVTAQNNLQQGQRKQRNDQNSIVIASQTSQPQKHEQANIIVEASLKRQSEKQHSEVPQKEQQVIEQINQQQNAQQQIIPTLKTNQIVQSEVPDPI